MIGKPAHERGAFSAFGAFSALFLGKPSLVPLERGASSVGQQCYDSANIDLQNLKTDTNTAEPDPYGA
jgi:hypothetical protein